MILPLILLLLVGVGIGVVIGSDLGAHGRVCLTCVLFHGKRVEK